MWPPKKVSGVRVGTRKGFARVSVIRILVVEDHKPFRQFVCAALSENSDWEVVGEASDGLEAVQKAQILQPDLIVLDIGLPLQDGFKVARQVRRVCDTAKILFLSQYSSNDTVEEAFSLGAMGYVVKARAGRELIPAVEAVSVGRQFVTNGYPGYREINSRSRSSVSCG